MNLYFQDRETLEKRYLPFKAHTRTELMQVANFPTGYFLVGKHIYHVSEVYAESVDNTIAGAIIGGLLGALGGPISALLLMFMGATAAYGDYKKSESNVAAFNKVTLPY